MQCAVCLHPSPLASLEAARVEASPSPLPCVRLAAPHRATCTAPCAPINPQAACPGSLCPPPTPPTPSPTRHTRAHTGAPPVAALAPHQPHGAHPPRLGGGARAVAHHGPHRAEGRRAQAAGQAAGAGGHAGCCAAAWAPTTRCAHSGLLGSGYSPQVALCLGACCRKQQTMLSLTASPCSSPLLVQVAAEMKGKMAKEVDSEGRKPSLVFQ